MLYTFAVPNVMRILDANANRAREALRVMEEAARFVLNDRPLSEAIKETRHALAKVLSALPSLEANRDTPNDVGTTISTPTEASRQSAADVAIAAGKRLSEALRAIEEFGKTLPDSVGPTGFAAAIERLRYKGYDLEKRLNQAMSPSQRQQWKLCVLLTEASCEHHDWLDVLEATIEGGADCIQIREKEMDAGWLVRRLDSVLVRVGGRASVIVNDRPDVALAAGADGVHLGQTDLTPQQVRRFAGRQLLIGVSTSNLSQAQRAIEHGADYCGVGPMFQTSTKKKDHIVGPDYLKQYTDAYPRLPHLAIGGITSENLPELVAAGCRGIAVCHAVCGARDPKAATEALITAIET